MSVKMNIYDFKVEKPDGQMLDLNDLKGKVMIIVNTATGCGFTPHYRPLEEMYEKADVNGENAIPLFRYLKSQKGFEPTQDMAELEKCVESLI